MTLGKKEKRYRRLIQTRLWCVCRVGLEMHIYTMTLAASRQQVNESGCHLMSPSGHTGTRGPGKEFHPQNLKATHLDTRHGTPGLGGRAARRCRRHNQKTTAVHTSGTSSQAPQVRESKSLGQRWGELRLNRTENQPHSNVVAACTSAHISVA